MEVELVIVNENNEIGDLKVWILLVLISGFDFESVLS